MGGCASLHQIRTLILLFITGGFWEGQSPPARSTLAMGGWGWTPPVRPGFRLEAPRHLDPGQGWDATESRGCGSSHAISQAVHMTSRLSGAPLVEMLTLVMRRNEHLEKHNLSRPGSLTRSGRGRDEGRSAGLMGKQTKFQAGGPQMSFLAGLVTQGSSRAPGVREGGPNKGLRI